MRSLIRTQIWAIIISILFLLLSNLTLAEALTQPNQKDSDIYTVIDEPSQKLPTYVPVQLNMMENNKLTPEGPPEEATSSMVVCPNGFVPAWWSIRKHRGSTEWRDVGTWETIKVGKALQATGNIQFRIWVTFIGAGTPGTSEFEFHWKRNEEIIASKGLSVRLEDGMSPYLIDTQANLVNQTPFMANDQFKLYIRCRISLDGARILYGSTEHKTHVQMTCDPLEVTSIKASDHGIKGYYSDVFRVQYTKMTFIARIDGKDILDPPPEFGVEIINNQNANFVSWDIKLEPATYDIEIGLSYLRNDNTSIVSTIQSIKIEAKKIPSFLGLPMYIWNYIVIIITLIIILIICVAAYNRYQEKKWIEEFESK